MRIIHFLIVNGFFEDTHPSIFGEGGELFFDRTSEFVITKNVYVKP